MRKLLTLLAVITVLGSMGAAIADDDVDGGEDSAIELNATQTLKAQLLAEYFSERLGGGTGDGTTETGASAVESDTTPADALFEEIVMLRTGDEVVGWGALYKLLLIAEANDTTLADVVSEYGEDGWGFGKIFRELRENAEDGTDWRGDTPRNLGQFKKQQREAAESSGPVGSGKAKKGDD